MLGILLASLLSIMYRLYFGKLGLANLRYQLSFRYFFITDRTIKWCTKTMRVLSQKTKKKTINFVIWCQRILKNRAL